MVLQISKKLDTRSPLVGVQRILLGCDNYPHARNELQNARDSHFPLGDFVRKTGDERAEIAAHEIVSVGIHGCLFDQIIHVAIVWTIVLLLI